jgi:hypothetical protein
MCPEEKLPSRIEVKDTPSVSYQQGERTSVRTELQSHAPSPNWPAWIFGGLLVLFFMGVIWFKPQVVIGNQQQKLLRILASVLVGVISGFFTGNLRLEGKVPALKDVQIGAIGGFAGFALTFFLW